jgi:hypothetical protein
MKQITLLSLSCLTLIALAGCRRKKVCCPKSAPSHIEYCETAERVSGVYDPEVKWETWEKEQYPR